MTVPPASDTDPRPESEIDGTLDTPEARAAVLNILPACIASWPLSLHKDQHGQAWARVLGGAHPGPIPLTSERFRALLVKRLAGAGAVPKPSLLNLCVSVLTALADEAVCEVANRSAVGVERDTVWIDLADKARRAVRVDPGGYRVEGEPPATFEPFAHQLPLPEPAPGGEPGELFRYLAPLAADDRLLLLTFAATAWVPMPRPILILVGPQGAAKSTFACFLRRLIDPSRIELLGPDDRADLPLIFHKHLLPVFDNVGSLSAKQADLFCQATTGRGFDRRKLYTDKESVILAVKRPIVFTCLQLPTTRADFLDRSLILDLERVPPEARRDLGSLEAEFEGERPRLFGALLGLLSKALRALPEVSGKGLSRMADFHRLGRAVAVASGSAASDFDRAWAAAEARQKRGTLGEPLAQAFWLFARQAGAWEGAAEDLVRGLYDTAKQHRVRISEADGLTPVGLGRRLKVLAETLARFGVRISQRRRARVRNIVLEYDQDADAEAQNPDGE